MAEFKGTPGPWAARRVEPSRDWIGTSYIIEPAVFKDAPGGIAATIGGLEGEDANARLIAAAPELLEALQWALVFCAQPKSTLVRFPNYAQRYTAAQAAIAKALGR